MSIDVDATCPEWCGHHEEGHDWDPVIAETRHRRHDVSFGAGSVQVALQLDEYWGVDDPEPHTPVWASSPRICFPGLAHAVNANGARRAAAALLNAADKLEAVEAHTAPVKSVQEDDPWWDVREDTPEKAATRREHFGHVDERDVPAYCTCGKLTEKCPMRPRRWSSRWLG